MLLLNGDGVVLERLTWFRQPKLIVTAVLTRRGPCAMLWLAIKPTDTPVELRTAAGGLSLIHI